MEKRDNRQFLIYMKDYSVGLPHIDRTTPQGKPVYFGYNNLYPQECLKIANASPLQKRILENKLVYCMGLGIEDYDGSIRTPNLAETWEDFFRKLMTDYVYLETFAVQIIPNEAGEGYSFFHQPADQVRLGNYGSDNRITMAYLCADWQRGCTTDIIPIKMWGSEQPVRGEKYLAVFSRLSTGELYYHIPSYMASANWLLADTAISKHYCNFISNNFSANTVITYPSEPEEDKKDLLYEGLMQSFGGSKNSGALLLLFGEGGQKPEVSSLSSTDADLYDEYARRVMENIISTNGLTSPVLAGIATGNGFNNKSDEILAAYALYMNTIIYDVRSFVMDKVNYLLNLNGFKRCLRIADLNLKAELEGNTFVNDVKEKETQDVESGDKD
jgi:hypothetical protein